MTSVANPRRTRLLAKPEPAGDPTGTPGNPVVPANYLPVRAEGGLPPQVTPAIAAGDPASASTPDDHDPVAGDVVAGQGAADQHVADQQVAEQHVVDQHVADREVADHEVVGDTPTQRPGGKAPRQRQPSTR